MSYEVNYYFITIIAEKMSDVLFEELDQKLLGLSSDRQVNELVDLSASVQSTLKSEFLAYSVRSASCRMHSARVLFLLKFVSLYAKKDDKFFKLIERFLPQVCAVCYSNSCDKETLELFVGGWKMRVAPWPVIAESAMNLIKTSKHKPDLVHVCNLLSGNFPNQIRHHPEDAVALAEDRLDKVIAAINVLHRVVDRV